MYEQTSEAYNALAGIYAEKFSDVSTYAAGIDRFIKDLPQNAKVLEPGCGPGNCTRYLLEKRPDLEILGTDVAPNMLTIAQENNPSAVFSLMDYRDLDQIETLFDGVFCSFVIPYLHKEDNRRMMSVFRDLLPSGGLLYLSFIEGGYDNSAYQWSSDRRYQTFVHYYTQGFFEGLLTEIGFDPVETFKSLYARSGNQTECHVAMVWRKR